MLARVHVRLEYFLAPKRSRFPCLSPRTPTSLPLLSRTFTTPPSVLSTAAPFFKQARDAKHAFVTRLRSSAAPTNWAEEQVYLTGDS
jgi:hypothetical protein